MDLSKIEVGAEVRFRAGGTGVVTGCANDPWYGLYTKLSIDGLEDNSWETKTGKYFADGRDTVMDIMEYTNPTFDYKNMKVGDRFEYNNNVFDFTTVTYIGDDPRDLSDAVGLFSDDRRDCRILAVVKDDRLGKFLGGK